jgi:23S rRNA (guanosine2251-2'-O)-methyltransferase
VSGASGPASGSPSEPEADSEPDSDPEPETEVEPERAPDDVRVIFGVHPVEEALRARHRDLSVLFVAEGTRSADIDRVVRLARDRAVPLEFRPRQLVAELAGATAGRSIAHQGLVAITGAYRYVSLDDILGLAAARREAPLVLVLDGITDPHNFGALVRSAEVLGAHGLVIAERHAAPVNGTVVKASAGATERMRIARVSNLLRTIDALREREIMVLGAAAPAAPGAGAGPEGRVGARRPPAVDELDLRGAVALVIGAEGQGMREAVVRRCDGVFHIPQAGVVSSLNASVAGAIALYEVARQRRHAPAQS